MIKKITKSEIEELARKAQVNSNHKGIKYGIGNEKDLINLVVLALKHLDRNIAAKTVQRIVALLNDSFDLQVAFVLSTRQYSQQVAIAKRSVAKLDRDARQQILDAESLRGNPLTFWMTE